MNRFNFEIKPWLLVILVALGTATAPARGQTLTLTVNVSSGDTTLNNTSASPITIDAYSILSTAGALNPSGWQSFNSNGFVEWDEANASNIHISETSLTSSRAVTNGVPIVLGSPVVPPVIEEFGIVATQPVQFQYHVAGGTTQTGQVTFEGNTLELLVDASTGEAQIVNPTGFNVAIDGYSIVSLSESLNPSGWQSLDQAGQPGWDEATNASSKHVSETNLFGQLAMPKLEQGSPISLGALYSGGSQDLQFTFHAAVGGASGDYNEDGIVDLADYTVWRDNLGAVAGTLPNDADGGVIGSAQYQTWKDNFGETGGGTFQTYTGLVRYVSLAPLVGAAATVPEPSGWLIAGMLAGAMGWIRVRNPWGLKQE